jgi:hypothetical protein
MNLVDRFNSREEFLAFRDHLNAVLTEKLSLPLKSRKLDELVAAVVGAKNFNTALGALEKTAPKSIMSVIAENMRGHTTALSETTKGFHEHPLVEAHLVTRDNSINIAFSATPYFDNLVSTASAVRLIDEMATLMACRFRVSCTDLNVASMYLASHPDSDFMKSVIEDNGIETAETSKEFVRPADYELTEFECIVYLLSVKSPGQLSPIITTL